MKRQSKIDLLRQAMAAGDWRAAIGIAAKFPRLGAEKEIITRAQSAYLRPDFYRQIGLDPDGAIDAAKAALRRRYGAPA